MPGTNLGECGRFSPACAGNTQVAAAMPSSWPVQPRVCGEHQSRGGRPDGNRGSAPRVRGTRCLRGLLRRRLRFSPACAGNTHGEASRKAILAVQPRVCGEHICTAVARIIATGSAPRVRGTLLPHQPRRGGKRFSPACAGNTSSGWMVSTLYPVQPRVCGEHSSQELKIDQELPQCQRSHRIRGLFLMPPFR